MGIILVSGQLYPRKAHPVPKGARLERVDCIMFEKSDHSVTRDLLRVILAYGFNMVGFPSKRSVTLHFLSFGLFSRLVKSRLELETKEGDSDKWNFVADG